MPSEPGSPKGRRQPNSFVKDAQLLQNLNPLDPFTLSPSIFGGRHARKGFAFQDWWIAYIIVGLLLNETDFVYARIEGLEDLDVLISTPNESVERYYQLKSKQEGTGNWTVARLEQEAIFTRFGTLFFEFKSLPHDETRRIEFVLVLEGDVGKEVLALKDVSPVRQPLIFSILASTLLTRELPKLGSEKQTIQEAFGRHVLGFAGAESDVLADLKNELRTRLRLEPEHLPNVENAGRQAFRYFAEFLNTIHVESRAAGLQSDLLKEATIARLVKAADISTNEAQAATARLVEAINQESLRDFPTLINRSLLLKWLALKQKPTVQARPTLVPDYVERELFEKELQEKLKSNRSLALYGISKMGKSQVASHALETLGYLDSYFWFAFSGDTSDFSILCRSLAGWIGVKFGIWEILNDFEEGRTTLQVGVERIAAAIQDSSLVVLDDCHKLKDVSAIQPFLSAFERYDHLKIMFLSEVKQPELESSGVPQLPVPGFQPREVLAFVRKQGLNPNKAILELIGMSAKFGGHPLMLKAACQILSGAPTGEEVNAVAEDLPSVTSTRAFLEALSNRLFFDLLRSPDQRHLVSRLAVLPGLFDKRVALSLADLRPKLSISGADWTLVSSTLLDSSGEGRFSFPGTLKHIAEDSLPSTVSRSDILKRAALVQFTPRRATEALNFLDFQAGMLSLILAKDYKLAAHFFTLAVPALLRGVDFEFVRLFLIVLNSDQVHAELESDFVRWQLLIADVMLRTRNTQAAKDRDVAKLFRSMHAIATHQSEKRWLFRYMILSLLGAIQLRRIDPNQPTSTRLFAKIASPITLAVKIATQQKEPEQAAVFLHFFVSSARWLSVSQMDLLAEALLTVHLAGKEGLSPNSLAELYAQFAVANSELSRKFCLLNKHSDNFKRAEYLDGYVAAMYGLATFEHEHNSEYSKTRHIAQTLIKEVQDIPRFRAIVDRLTVLLADTYWAEKLYQTSATTYAVCLKGHHRKPIREHIQNRLIDSLISVGNLDQATAQIIRILRRRRRQLEARSIAHLYARLAYAYAEFGDLMKAAIACVRLDRIAHQTGLEELQYISFAIAAWVLQHAKFDDPLIPRPCIQIVSSSVISDRISDEDLAAWRTDDKFSIKARMQIATVFELHGKPKRGRVLLQEALQAIENAPEQPSLAHAITLRLIRNALLEGNLIEAAKKFVEVVVSSAEERIAIDIAAYANWSMLEKTLAQLSDRDLSRFADLISAETFEYKGVQAAIRLQQSRALFSRLLPIDARFRLDDAERLAKESSADQTLVMVYVERLLHQVRYREWKLWLADALVSFLELAADYISVQSRQYFATSLKSFMEGNSKAFRSILPTVEKYWSLKPFETAGAALLLMARSMRLQSEQINRVERLLAANVPVEMLSVLDLAR